MLRIACALALLVAPVTGLAAPTAPPSEEPARDGGVIEGRLISVDYGRSVIVVDVNRRRVSVDVLPTTTIQTPDAGYHSIGDLKAGERLRILSSFAGGVYTAQIIRVFS